MVNPGGILLICFVFCYFQGLPGARGDKGDKGEAGERVGFVSSTEFMLSVLGLHFFLSLQFALVLENAWSQRPCDFWPLLWHLVGSLKDVHAKIFYRTIHAAVR